MELLLIHSLLIWKENSSRQPVNYLMPPGVERVQLLSNNGVNLQQNEQAMSMQIRDLTSGDSRAVFKTVPLISGNLVDSPCIYMPSRFLIKTCFRR